MANHEPFTNHMLCDSEDSGPDRGIGSIEIRLLLAPVLRRVTGRWAWYLPRCAHRMLPAVTFGHA